MFDNNNNIKEYLTFGNILSIIAIIVSIVAIIFSVKLNNKTNTLTEKVYSKEYQISEELKYELLKVVADLKSIESKTMIEPFFQTKIDYSKEIEDIAIFRTSPGYLIYLHSMESDDDRLRMDINLLMLTSLTNSDVVDYKFKRAFSHNALEVLTDKTDLERTLNMEISDLIKDLCKMRVVAPDYKKEESNDEGVIESFLGFLLNEKKIDDADVLLFYSVYKNDTIDLKRAIDSGGNPRITLFEIIERYQEEYDEFAKYYEKEN